jgi:hypothetical protein
MEIGHLSGFRCLQVRAYTIAPTFCSAAAEEWIASNASLLNLRLVAMTKSPPSSDFAAELLADLDLLRR